MRIGRVSAARRLENELVHAGKVTQDEIKIVHDLQQALQRLIRLEGMDRRQLGP